jgi:hypothetical protein
LASGIIGNIGYDVLKATLRAWRRPRLRLPQQARDMRDAALVAVLATQARCAQVDLPVPTLEELELVQCKRLADRWRVVLRRTERGPTRYGDRSWPQGVALGAVVVIPDGPLDGHDVEVTVLATASRNSSTASTARAPDNLADEAPYARESGDDSAPATPTGRHPRYRTAPIGRTDLAAIVAIARRRCMVQ